MNKEILDEITDKIGDGSNEMFSDNLSLLKELPLSKKLLSNIEELSKKELSNTIELKVVLSDILKEIKTQELIIPEPLKVWIENQVPMPKSFKVNNLNEIQFPEATRISNLKDINIPDSIEIKNSPFIVKQFVGLLEGIIALSNKIFKVNVTNSDPQKPIAVRLSDGKNFYNSLGSVISGTIGRFVPFAKANGDHQEPLIDNDKHLQVDVLSAVITSGDVVNTPKLNVNHIDDITTTNVTYIGKETTDGTYLIQKIDQTGSFPVFTYASILNNPTLTTYSLAWAGRTTATYNLYSIAQ